MATNINVVEKLNNGAFLSGVTVAALEIPANKIVCIECGADSELYSLPWTTVCEEHFRPIEEKWNKFAAHLNKKDSLNAKLDFLTGFELWNQEHENQQICEELREQLVREKVPKKQQELL